MPATVNGVGTHYYGKRDAASRIGACRHCGAQGKLETYTTRLWFVIVFIPVIPLKRVRILDECPACRRHWVANPEQYEVSRQLAVSGALEKYRDQPSVDAALVVHAQLLTFHMHPEADTFRASALEKYPESAELVAGLASHLDQTGRWTEGTPLFEKAFELKPELPEVRNALAWRHTSRNELDRAYELLDFLRQPGAGLSFNLAPLETLAQAYQKQKNHERVIELCEHLVREIPAVGQQYEFRKFVARSEKALDRSPSMLPEKSFSIRGMFDGKSGTSAPWVRWAAFGSVAAVLFMVGMAGLNEYRRTHRSLYVLNGFAQPLTVAVDDGPPVQVTERTLMTLAEGRHRLSFTAPFTKQEEIALHSGYWSRWTHSPLWIFNAGKVAPVTEDTICYAVNPQPTKRNWLNDSEFNYVPHVDYVFEQAPQSMKVDSNSQTITKIRIGTTTFPPATIFLGLREGNDQEIALTFAEGYLNRNPNDVSLLSLYTQGVDDTASGPRVTAFLKSGLWRTPISVTWHRAYQNLKSIAANEAALAAEYDTQLISDPDNAALLYLRGRISVTRQEQLKYFRLANEKSPQSGWPAHGLAYDAAIRGNWREAKDLCDVAFPALRSDHAFRTLRHYVQIANGEANALEAEYRTQLTGQDYLDMVTSVYYLADVLAVQKKYDEARQVTRQWLAKIVGPGAPPETLSSFDSMLDYVCGDLERFRQEKSLISKTGLPQYRFQILLAIGDPDSAIAIDGVEKLLLEWPANLAVSLSYALQGNQTLADEWRSRACVKMQELDSDHKRAAALLQKSETPTEDELDQIALAIGETPLFLASLAARFPDRKSEWNQRAQRLNVSRLPPYLLVTMATEAP